MLTVVLYFRNGAVIIEVQNKEEVFLNILRGLARLNINTALQVVTQGEFFVLTMIKQFGDYTDNRDHPVNVSKMAEELDVSSAAVSRTLRGLEERAYLERITDPENRRNTYVKLTAKGRQLFIRENKEIEDLAVRVFTKMGESDMKLLFQLSKKLHNIMEEEIGTSDA